MINQKQVIESLKTEATTNAAANAVFHVWALRERARSQVTVAGLHLRMKEEGFSLDKKAYEPLFRRMADLGLGRLQTDAKGRVLAVKDIKVTLQSLGKAVVGGEGAIKAFRQKRRFKVIKTPRPEGAQPDPIRLHHRTPSPTVSLTVTVGAHPLTVSVPNDASNETLVALIKALRAAEVA